MGIQNYMVISQDWTTNIVVDIMKIATIKTFSLHLR